MTRLFRSLFSALSLCLLLVAAKPAAACMSEQDIARMEVRGFLAQLGVSERVERIDVALDKQQTVGRATVRFKGGAKPLVLGLEFGDGGWVITTRPREDS